MFAPVTNDAGSLRPCRPADDVSVLDADVARVHHQLRVELAAQLSQVVPDGWDVSAACVWASTEGTVLHPDVVVHRDLERGQRLPAPPALCVELAAGPPPGRSAQAYARQGVDHYWYVNSADRSLEVYLRVGDEYRRAESVRVEAPVDPSPARIPSSDHRTSDRPGCWWVDFGVAIVALDLTRLAPA